MQICRLHFIPPRSLESLYDRVGHQIYGEVIQNPPGNFSRQKHGNLSRNLNFFGFENPMINLYEKNRKSYFR